MHSLAGLSRLLRLATGGARINAELKFLVVALTKCVFCLYASILLSSERRQFFIFALSVHFYLWDVSCVRVME